MKYDYRALIQAYLDNERWKAAHPDLSTYHGQLFDHLSRHFGIRFSEDEFEGRREERWLFKVFIKAGRSVLTCPTAFEGFLEAPALVHAAYEQHGEALNSAKQAFIQANVHLMEDIVELLYAPGNRVVKSRDLMADGFDDSNPPDPNDYW